MDERKVKWSAEMDVNDMLTSIKKMAEEYRKAGATGQAEGKKLEMSAAEIRTKIKELGGEIENLKDVNAIDAKRKEMQGYEAALDSVIGKTREMPSVEAGAFKGSFLGSLSGSIATKGLDLAASAIGSIGEAMIGGNAEMETYTTQFATLLGSVDAAKDRLAELAAFGAATPFELPEIARAEKVLVGFGLTGQKVIGLTGKTAEEFRTIVGDIAAGTGASFEEIALNMGKLSSGATGEAISRFQELGIATREQLTAMGVQFSKSGELLSPLPVAMQAVTKLTAEKFGGGMAALSATFSGLASTFQDVLGQIGRDIGAPLFEKAKEGLLKILDVLSDPATQKAIGAVAETLGEVIGFLAENADLVGTAAGAMLLFKTNLQGAGKALDGLGAILTKNPMGVYVTLVLGAVAAIKALSDAASESAQERYDAIEVDKELVAQEKAIVQEQKAGAESTKQLADRYIELADKQGRTKEEQKELQKVSDDLDKQYPGLIQNTKDFTDSLDGVRKVANDAQSSISKYTDELGRLDQDMLSADLALANQQVFVELAKMNEEIASAERNILGKASKAVFGTDTVLDNVREWTASFKKGISSSGTEAQVKESYREFTRKIRAAIDEEGLSSAASESAITGAQRIRDLRLKYLQDRANALNPPPPPAPEAEAPPPPPPINWDQIFKNRQLEIDLIDEQSRKLMEQYLLDQDIAKNKIKDARELSLTLQKIEKKFMEDAEALSKKRDDAVAQARIATLKDESERLLAQYEFDKSVAERDIKDTEERDLKLLQLEQKFNADAEKLNIDNSDRIRQLRIDAIDDEERRLLENFKFKMELIDRELISEEEKALKKKALEKESGKGLLELRKKGAKDEEKQYTKGFQTFLDDYAKPIAAATNDLLWSMTDAKMSNLEREQAFWNSMKSIAMNVTGQIVQDLIAQGAAALASLIGITTMQAPLAAATGSMWAGPAALASTATFGGAAVAGAAGLSTTYALAEFMATPKFLKEGGLLSKPTFVAAEAGTELVGSLRDIIPIIREAVLGPPVRRTKILNRSQPRVNIGIGNKMFGRGSRSAQLSQTSGAF